MPSKSYSNRKATAQSYLNKDDSFKTLIANVPGITYRCYADKDWTMEFLSDEVTRLTGYPAVDFINNKVRSFTGIIHPEDRQKVSDLISEAISSDKVFEFEYRIITSHGECVWVRDRGRCVSGSCHEKPILEGVMIDITERKLIELELRKAKEELSDFFNHSLDFFLIIGNDGELLRVNREWERAFGYPIDKLQNKKILDFVHPEDLDRVISMLAKLNEQQEVINIESRILDLEGNYRWIEWRCKPKKDIIYAAARDITRRKNAETRLDAQYRLLEGVLNAIPDILTIQKPDNSIVRYNAAGYKVLNIKPTDIENKKCYELLGRQKRCEICPTYLAKKDKKTVRLEKYVPELDKYFDCYASPVLDENGEVTLIVEQLHDNTEQKLQTLRLHESESKYRTLVNQSSEMNYLHDLEGNIVDVNEATIKHTGYSREELLQMTVFDIHPQGSDRSSVLKKWSKWKPGEHYQIDYTHRRKDGSLYPVEISTSKIMINNQEHIHTMIQDITDRKKNEDYFQFQYNYQRLVSSIASRFVNVGYKILDDHMKESLGKICRFFEIDQSCLLRYDEEKGIFEPQYEFTAIQEQTKYFKPINAAEISQILKRLTKESYMVIRKDDIDSRTRRELGLSTTWETLLVFAIQDKQQTIGLLCFVNVLQNKEWEQDKILLIGVIVNIVTEVLKRKVLQDKIMKTEKHAAALAMAVTANHEINQPLMLVQGYLELISDNNLDPNMEKYLHEIEKGIARIKSILQKMNNISQMELTHYFDGSEMVKLPK